ncbi:hypothetical protein M405DRAFT_935520 [Rhizopogon salebrosus TDB-379]|nr:hypothetical protein M405DRAFT_935520 [Rhizopogon salebrosus TDB-379]
MSSDSLLEAFERPPSLVYRGLAIGDYLRLDLTLSVELFENFALPLFFFYSYYLLARCQKTTSQHGSNFKNDLQKTVQPCPPVAPPEWRLQDLRDPVLQRGYTFEFLGLTRAQRLYGFINWGASSPSITDAKVIAQSTNGLWSLCHVDSAWN